MTQQGTFYQDRTERAIRTLEQLEDKIAQLRDDEHEIIENPDQYRADRVDVAAQLRDLYALVEEAIQQRLHNSAIDLEVSAHNCQRGVDALLKLISGEL